MAYTEMEHTLTDISTLAHWDDIDTHKFADEEAYIEACLNEAAGLSLSERYGILQRGVELVKTARMQARRKGLMESFLEEFGLSNSEGLALMCLAEALLRVPDIETRDDLIAEKIKSGDWGVHMGQSDSWRVNASTLGLMLTGRIVSLPKSATKGPGTLLSNLIRESGEPVIRAAVMQAMRIMGEQFVLGRTIKEALKRGKKDVKSGRAAHFSFDMLGEGARTLADADGYFEAYRNALETLSQSTDPDVRPENQSGISIKLSALHPRYEARQEAQIMGALYPRLLDLAQIAARANINLCLDAEEADRLVLSLKLFERLAREPSLKDWQGLGLAVQAYQKRALSVLEKLALLARQTDRRFMVRLVKGAYWDSEIKHAQIEGFENYPVFTTKAGTDVNFLACANFLLQAGDPLYPQFATHNAHSLAAIETLARKHGDPAFEFQRLHGMGGALYDAAGSTEGRAAGVRIYAPVGPHHHLLPYLVRRLLENGANSSFVHSFLNPDIPPEDIITDPFTKLEAGPRRHPKIPTPPRLFGSARPNSTGVDLSQAGRRAGLEASVHALRTGAELKAGSFIAGKEVHNSPALPVHAPHDISLLIGAYSEAKTENIEAAIMSAQAYQPEWDALGGAKRADILRAVADTLEAHRARLIALIASEAGRTLKDGSDEVREAVDFCRYYACQAEAHFAAPKSLPGPSGEVNTLSLHGRGVFCAISPWNFPLAIFTGQIMAALAAGNTVLAKPAEQTSLIACEAVKLFHQAGVPPEALHLLLGPGETVGVQLTEEPRIDGYCFTGGTQTAHHIHRAIAKREGAIPTLIAETGGLNAMFVDTTALREQVIDDVIMSAFGSAGQRCSALRLAFLPTALFDEFSQGLIGAMEALHFGDPGNSITDIGPLIDAETRASLSQYLAHLPEGMRLLHHCDVGDIAKTGYGFGPALVEIGSLDALTEEKFGPILHIIRYDPDDLAGLSEQLRKTDYGLTLGIHSRLESFQEKIRAACPVGNTYVNRNMIGAMVGVQPFGGHGLSGTGPKAGGPYYLQRFATERTLTLNTAAQGGDPELLNLTGL